MGTHLAKALCVRNPHSEVAFGENVCGRGEQHGTEENVVVFIFNAS